MFLSLIGVIFECNQNTFALLNLNIFQWLNAKSSFLIESLELSILKTNWYAWSIKKSEKWLLGVLDFLW